MHWERLSEDVYIFTSDRYAQVTASLVVSGTVGVVIDTLPFPAETSQIALFARRRCADGVRYVVYTQHQADHTYGAFLFPKAEIISHALCREILLARGAEALEQAKQLNRELELVRLRIPNLTLERGVFSLRLPGKTLDLLPTPGHTPDAISVLLQEEKILFAGDTVMAIPTITEGDPVQLRGSIETIAAMPLESIVQGHGEIILRGEIKDNIKRSLNYLEQLTSKVRKVVDTGGTLNDARAITIESCGLQRVLLNGMVTQLHVANAVSLYNRLAAERKELGLAIPTAVENAEEEKRPARTARKRAPVQRGGRKQAGRKREPKSQTARKTTAKKSAGRQHAAKPSSGRRQAADKTARTATKTAGKNAGRKNAGRKTTARRGRPGRRDA